jgi:hypothetical protein
MLATEEAADFFDGKSINSGLPPTFSPFLPAKSFCHHFHEFSNWLALSPLIWMFLCALMLLFCARDSPISPFFVCFFPDSSPFSGLESLHVRRRRSNCLIL